MHQLINITDKNILEEGVLIYDLYTKELGKLTKIYICKEFGHIGVMYDNDEYIEYKDKELKGSLMLLVTVKTQQIDAANRIEL